MKLLLAIIRDDFAADVTFALNSRGLSVTKVSTTGGFWRRGNVTLMIGLEDETVDEALEVINEHAGPEVEPALAPSSHPPRRATIFVVNIDSFDHY